MQEARNVLGLTKKEAAILAVANAMFIIVSVCYATNDSSIPFWDHKVHAQRSLELLSALKSLEFKKMLYLLASDRAPGLMIPLAPILAPFPATLHSLQILALIFYGNVFVIGCCLLAKTLWPAQRTTWYLILPTLCPILWSLGLKPFFDLGPLVLTPWIFLLAFKTEYFQNFRWCALFGAVLGLEILFRSYGAYVCIAFSLAYVVYYLESALLKEKPNSGLLRGVMGLGISLLAFLPIAAIPLAAIAHVLMSDMGKTSYLWASNDHWYYLRTLQQQSLGGVLFALGLSGIALFSFTGTRPRLITYFLIITLIIFQFVIDNKDPRYAGVFAAIFTVGAAYLMSQIGLQAREKRALSYLAKVTTATIALVLSHQLYVMLFPVTGKFHRMLANGLHYPQEPLFAYAGNQQRLMEQVWLHAQKAGITTPSIYFGKDRPEFNYDYVNWFKFTDGKDSRYADWRVHHSDVPRFHGIPVNFFDMDLVIMGQTPSPFNARLLEDYYKNKHFLNNFEPEAVLDLELKDRREPLALYRKVRRLNLQEQIKFQEAVLDLDPDNFHNIEQLLWLFKVQVVNRLTDKPDSPLVKAARMIPLHFSSSNIKFDCLKPYVRFAGLLTGTEKHEFQEFYGKRGAKPQSSYNFELNRDVFDNPYTPDWLFMVKEQDSWAPLVAQKWLGEVWKDRKWGSLVSESHISKGNDVIVVDKPVAVYWVAPAAGACSITCSVSPQGGSAKLGVVEVALNGTNLRNSINGANTYTCSGRFMARKGDLVSVTFQTPGSYKIDETIKYSGGSN